MSCPCRGRCPCHAAAAERDARRSSSESRRAYRRDYERGRAHAARARAPEEGASEAYRTGYASRR